MKKQRLLFVILTAALVAFSTSACSQNPGGEGPDVDPTTVKNFTLSRDIVNVSVSGGNSSIAYTSVDGTAPEDIQVDTDADWVDDFVTTAFGKIGFTVDPYTDASQPRECTVSVVFAGDTESQTFKVVQNTYSFRIEVDALIFKGVAYTVIPTDKDMTYLTMCVTAEAFDRYESDEEWYLAELDYFKTIAGATGVSLESYMTRILMSGDEELAEILKPSTDYVIYAYGLNHSGERLTEIVTKRITTPPLQKIDVSFNFEYFLYPQTERVVVHASPTSHVENPYFLGVMNTKGLAEDENMAEIAQGYLDYVIQEYAFREGLSVAEAVERVTYKGMTMADFECLAENSYVIFAAMVDPDAGLVISDATVMKFSTETPEPSDNQFTLTAKDVTFNKAKIAITTTNDDQYIFASAPENHYAGKTDDQILADLVSRGQQLTKLNGNYTVEYTDRTAGAGYVGYAFGYLNGVATTGLTKISYRTHAFNESTISLDIAAEKYFDAKALKAAYPDEFAEMPGAMTVVLPVWATVTPANPGARIYYQILSGDISTSTDTKKLYETAESLLSTGCPLPSVNFYMPYNVFDTPYTIVGVVADETGKFGSLFRKKVIFSQSGFSPVGEYVSPTN